MTFSIIICTYNRAEELAIVLAQLERQLSQIKTPVEILIVDNNSTDRTQTVVEEFTKRTASMRYISEKRQGKPFALNTAIKEATGDWLIFTDDDVRFEDNWLNEIIRAAERYPVQCFVGKIVPLWNSEKPAWYEDTIGGVIVRADHGDEYKPKMNYLVGANMAIHKNVFKLIGGFNEGIKRFEDSEFSLRVREKMDIAYVPQAVVYHPVSTSRLTKKYFKGWYFEMGRMIDSRLLEKQDKKLFGIPRWVYREFISQFFSSLISHDPKKHFYHELQVTRFLGIFKQKWLSA
jgi:GT2 family glycosyltransferase